MVRQENIARQIAAATDDPIVRQLAEAFAKSNRLIAEDILREAGYMLPQSGNAHALLAALLDAPQDADFPAATVRQLLGALPDNDAQGK